MPRTTWYLSLSPKIDCHQQYSILHGIQRKYFRIYRFCYFLDFFAHFLDFFKPFPQLPETVSPSSEGVGGRATSKIMSPIRILLRGIVYMNSRHVQVWDLDIDFFYVKKNKYTWGMTLTFNGGEQYYGYAAHWFLMIKPAIAVIVRCLDREQRIQYHGTSKKIHSEDFTRWHTSQCKFCKKITESESARCEIVSRSWCSKKFPTFPDPKYIYFRIFWTFSKILTKITI